MITAFVATMLFTAQPAWVLGPFTKADAANPVLWPQKRLPFNCPMRKGPVNWEENDVFNPAAAIKDGKLILLYRAEDKLKEGLVSGQRTSRVGYAESSDGRTFARDKFPVLYPSQDLYKQYEWEGGCEDPRIVQSPDGTWVLTYTGWDRKTARLCAATSRDLKHWKKHGPVFTGPARDVWSKSGSIVTKLTNGKLVATKIQGKYWMYYGEGDLSIATSTDLTHWSPVVDKSGSLVKVLHKRKGMFDSELVEPGPPALLTQHGIVLLYNCKNSATEGDKTLAPGTYAPSQALFSPTNPTKLIARLNTPFMKPDRNYEIDGQVNHVCFIEGLVPFKGKWMLYYGTADSRIALTTAPLK